MLVIIPKDKEDFWLDPKITKTKKLPPLLTPYPSDEMKFYGVSPIISKPEYDLPEVFNSNEKLKGLPHSCYNFPCVCKILNTLSSSLSFSSFSPLMYSLQKKFAHRQGDKDN
jgi:hypothetical protein